MRTRYPLSWPMGYERTPTHKRRRWPGKQASENWSFTTIRNALVKEIESSGGTDFILSTNIEVRRDGLPYAGRRQPEDPGVAVYWELDEQWFEIACDEFKTVEGNMQALRLTVGDLRRIQKRGTTGIFKRAMSGLEALPERGSGKPWWEVLEVPPDAEEGVITAAYRQLAKVRHPQRGGSDVAWHELNDARQQGLAAAAGS